MIITREILLNSGFEWYEYESNSKNNHSGQYTYRRTNDNECFTIRISRHEGFNSYWHLYVGNFDKRRTVELDNLKELTYLDLRRALTLCEININIIVENDEHITQVKDVVDIDFDEALLVFYRNNGSTTKALMEMIGNEHFYEIDRMGFIAYHIKGGCNNWYTITEKGIKYLENKFGEI